MKLIFIYNANSGRLNALLHAGHKLFSPSTYPCSLCALTYDTVRENSTWKSFRKETNLELGFYHKDEFETKFPKVNMTYPAVLKLENSQLTVIINDEILNAITTVDALIEKLKITL
ncbi:GTPase [Winogradskyella sp. UBA3174]|uniref:GTPase n=1 Tax=Winogradskyella sp. UBA3174 TaxID=1947785 RepID=UPI0025EA6007|nr:GTPase [Winogradskyella sp. UBA3174]|tara:strand:- start:7050 stop:7397 length:348 start_codon:yes stop_codon:yes gene_type:complete